MSASILCTSSTESWPNNRAQGTYKQVQWICTGGAAISQQLSGSKSHEQASVSQRMYIPETNKRGGGSPTYRAHSTPKSDCCPFRQPNQAAPGQLVGHLVGHEWPTLPALDWHRMTDSQSLSSMLCTWFSPSCSLIGLSFSTKAATPEPIWVSLG